MTDLTLYNSNSLNIRMETYHQQKILKEEIINGHNERNNY